MTEPFKPADGHQINPQLAALVRAAQNQPEPRVSVRFKDVQRAAARRWHRGAVAVALAAGLAGLFVWTMRDDDPRPSTPQADAIEIAEAQAYEESTARVPDMPPSAARPAAKTATITLAGGASFERLGQDARDAAPELVDGLPVQLSPGRYSIRTEANALELPLGTKVLEVQTASEVVVNVGIEHVTFEVVRGRASWQTPENVGMPEEGTERAKGRTAAQLQARAEAALIRGDRAEAIATLRTLVRRHPRSAASKAALIDLARLEKAAGRLGRARCAYALFLRRFPADARAPSVKTASATLGTAQCRGLDPQSR